MGQKERSGATVPRGGGIGFPRVNTEITPGDASSTYLTEGGGLVNLRCSSKTPITTTNEQSKGGEGIFPRVEFISGYQKIITKQQLRNMEEATATTT